MKKKSQRIAACLITVQMGMLSGSAIAADRPNTKSSYGSYSSEMSRTKSFENGVGAFAGGVMGMTALSATMIVRTMASLETPRMVGYGAWAAAFLVGAGIGHIASKNVDGRKSFIESVKQSPEYQALIIQKGKPKADEFLADLIAVYDEGMSDEAVTEFLKKYPEVKNEAGQMMAISNSSLNDSARKLFVTGNPVAIAAEYPAGSDASVANKALE